MARKTEGSKTAYTKLIRENFDVEMADLPSIMTMTYTYYLYLSKAMAL